MRLALTILLALPLAQAAAAQTLNKPVTKPDLINRTEYYERNTKLFGDRNVGLDRTKQRECLTQKATGKVICLTRSEWQDVATGKRSIPGG